MVEILVFQKIKFYNCFCWFSDKIVFRNKAKLNDDIYVTGNLGDSFIGLKVLKKNSFGLKKIYQIILKKNIFILNLQYKITKKLLSIANTSIDISDGLIVI